MSVNVISPVKPMYKFGNVASNRFAWRVVSVKQWTWTNQSAGMLDFSISNVSSSAQKTMYVPGPNGYRPVSVTADFFAKQDLQHIRDPSETIVLKNNNININNHNMMTSPMPTNNTLYSQHNMSMQNSRHARNESHQKQQNKGSYW